MDIYLKNPVEIISGLDKFNEREVKGSYEIFNNSAHSHLHFLRRRLFG